VLTASATLLPPLHLELAGPHGSFSFLMPAPCLIDTLPTVSCLVTSPNTSIISHPACVHGMGAGRGGTRHGRGEVVLCRRPQLFFLGRQGATLHSLE
jgi:hypothetical protein